MAFWNNGQINNIFEGALPNDGTGDNIRDAFLKVDNNFGNISTQLGQFNQDWTNANIAFNLNATNANITNSFISNSTGITSAFSGNTYSANIIANTGLYSYGTVYSGNILPRLAGTYNLGSPTMPFANLYVQNTVSTNQITQSTDAGILKIHANAFIGDIQDTGILGNISSDYGGANTYAFFGHQYATDNFIYKIVNIDATKGNNIVVGGVYGNVQFGSGIFSNTTPSTSSTTGALIVTGGAGVGGNVTVGGNINVTANIYVSGSQVLTTSSSGLGTIYNGTSAIITGNVVYPSATPSTSYSTGALVVPFGGVGVYGNVVAGGLVGSLYGTVQTPAQPQITSLGTLTGLSMTGGSTLNASSISATSINTTNLTVTSGITATGVALSGLFSIGASSASITGNITSGNISTGGVSATYYFGSGSYLTGLINNPTIQTLNANVGAYEIWANSSIQTLSANLGAYQISDSANVGSIFTNLNTLTANVGAYETWANAQLTGGSTASLSANLGAYQIYANANIGTIFTNLNTLTANVGTIFTNLNTLNANVGTYENTTNANIGTQFNSLNTINANVGTYQNTTNANIGTQFTRLNTLDANVGSLGGNVGVVSYISKNALSVGGNLTVTGNILPVANATVNMGDSTHWFGTIYGKAVQAQYADLAENYVADLAYEPGTVLVFGGEAEVTTTTTFADSRVAGAISTDPAYLMNGGLAGDTIVAIALRGRIPCRVIGPVHKGDLLVTAADAGYATSVGADRSYGTAVFAKSLETNLDASVKIVEVVII